MCVRAVVLSYTLHLATGAPEPASRFLRASFIKQEDAFAQLNKELWAQVNEDRIVHLETLLQPMYVALPKLEDGTLGTTVMRYALHRLLAEAHGWFIIGLEPERDGMNMSVSSVKTQMEWAPSYLQEVLESSHRGHGVSLHEVAVLAATLEDLARKEAFRRLEAIYDIYGLKTTDPFHTDEDIDLILDSFALVYLKGGNWTVDTALEAKMRVAGFAKKQDPRLFQWLNKLRADAFSNVGAQNFTMLQHTVENIGKEFGSYMQVDCSSLKQTLASMEDRMPGRVLLSDFYDKGLHGLWRFTEKIEYLRDLGALDESDPGRPRVIVPNYIGSRPQCRASSGLYVICCPNECEVLMKQLERAIGEPEASPERVRGLVENLSSPSVPGPRVLSTSLNARLEAVAAANGGRVPLHGRLFAQWMHNAFPRECAFPHISGTTSPQTPDEWMRNTGYASTEATEEEMVCHVSGPCSGGSSAPIDSIHGDLQRDIGSMEIPWSDAEELLGGPSRLSIGRAFNTAGKVVAQEHRAFNNVLRTVLVSGTGLGIALSFKAPLRQSCLCSENHIKIHRAWARRTFLLVSLLFLTLEFIFDMHPVYEIFLCGCCWMLGAFAYMTQQLQQHKSEDVYKKEKYAV